VGNHHNNLQESTPHAEDEDGSDPLASDDESDNNFTQSFETDDDDEALPVKQNHDAKSTTRNFDDCKNYSMYAIDRYEDFTDMEQNAIELLYTL
jgi:hypothetical protein